MQRSSPCDELMIISDERADGFKCEYQKGYRNVTKYIHRQ